MARTQPPIDRTRIALGIRQPWAELILRGIKTIEVRSLHTQVRGPIYIYASRKLSDHPAAQAAIEEYALEADELPKGVLVGTVDLIDSRPCVPGDAAAACLPKPLVRGKMGWHLANPERLSELPRPKFLPYGVWFYPFVRQNGAAR